MYGSSLSQLSFMHMYSVHFVVLFVDINVTDCHRVVILTIKSEISLRLTYKFTILIKLSFQSCVQSTDNKIHLCILQIMYDVLTGTAQLIS